MKRANWLSMVGAAALASVLVSCSEDATVPVALSSNTSSVGGTLKPMRGSGSGIVTVTPLDGQPGLSAQISVQVSGTLPNSLFYVQQSPEVDRPLGTDDVGERAAGMWPWEQPSSPGFPPAPAFLCFPTSGSGTPLTISTDDRGNGNTEFILNAPMIPHGSRFDVVFRVLNDTLQTTHADTSAGLETELRTDCFTVPVK